MKRETVNAPLRVTQWYEKYLVPQFEKGVLDIDGVALCLEHLRIKNPAKYGDIFDHIFVGGGLEDLDAIIFWAKLLVVTNYRKQWRMQVILRDYPTHWLTVDIYICNANELTILCFIPDSTPDSPTNAKKWLLLMRKHCEKSYVFTNPEMIQSDEYSCKIFSINIAKRLFLIAKKESNLKNESALYTYLFKHSQPNEDNVYILLEHMLPMELMKDTQSISRIENYCNINVLDKKGLLLYVEKHKGIDPTSGKVQNHSIYHKLTGYRKGVENLSIIISEKEACSITRRACGFSLFYDCVKQLSLESCMKKFGIYRGVHVTKLNMDNAQNGIKVDLPLYSWIPTPQEAPYPESSITALSIQSKDNLNTDVHILWKDYKPMLTKEHELLQGKTWFSGYHYCIRDNIATIITTIEECEYNVFLLKHGNVNDLLNDGCAQIFASFCVLSAVSTK